MISIIRQTMEFYFAKMQTPDIQDLEIINKQLIGTKGSCFVTFFLNGEVRASAGNIKWILSTLWEELIQNTLHAMNKDTRFTPLSPSESKEIKIRADFIKNRRVLARTDDEVKHKVETLAKIDPVKNGVIVIRKDYSKTVTILPNIDSKILVWSDYQNALSAKLWEIFDENKYIIYQIETTVEMED